MSATATATRIDLGGCAQGHCLEMAWRLKRQLDPAYSRSAAVMDVGSEPRRTARKRTARSERLGYRFLEIMRELWVDDIHAINTSAPERQGRPMGAGYREKPKFSHIPFLCDHHHVYTYGVQKDDHLVAYLWLYRCGDLAMVSSILGHADHLANDVMYLLFAGMLDRQKPLGGTVFYNRWDSGTEGLRFFKERLGFVEGNVEWAMS